VGRFLTPAVDGVRIDDNGLVADVESLRGQLLVASPALIDPNFRRTVVLLAEHGEEGSMGVVLNRPSPITVADSIPTLGGVVGAGELVYVGGPVQPGAVVALAEYDEPERAASISFADVGFLPSEVDVAELVGLVRRVRVFAGYSGWGGGQLEAELEAEAWISEPATADDVFTGDPAGLWSAVLGRKGGQYALLARMPIDPSVN
jgi:putative transcriptional regulator